MSAGYKIKCAEIPKQTLQDACETEAKRSQVQAAFDGLDAALMELGTRLGQLENKFAPALSPCDQTNSCDTPCACNGSSRVTERLDSLQVDVRRFTGLVESMLRRAEL